MNIGITGASGYVGRVVGRHLLHSGHSVVAFCRKPPAFEVSEHRLFLLGVPVGEDAFCGLDALIHCAYDFTLTQWEDVWQTNVLGTQLLIDAAMKAEVRKILVLSSASAYDGCRSKYGKAKYEIETICRRYCVDSIRPGLIYGEDLGGVFGSLVRQTVKSRILPLVGNGRYFQWLLHENDLCTTIEKKLTDHASSHGDVLFLSSKSPLTVRQLIKMIAQNMECNPLMVGIPWRLLYSGLRVLEILRLPAPFRSDSLLGLVYPNLNPDFRQADRLGISCREFEISPAMAASWSSSLKNASGGTTG